MTPTEAEDYLDQWFMGEEKGFKYHDYGLFDVEYLSIKKDSDNLYTVNYKKSTVRDGPFDRKRMEKLLGSNKLMPFHSTYSTDFKRIKSGPCECGAWATGNPTCHARWCPAFRD